MGQDFNSQDFELIIFGIVSAVCIAIVYVFKLLSEPDKLNRYYSFFKVRLRNGFIRFFLGHTWPNLTQNSKLFQFNLMYL